MDERLAHGYRKGDMLCVAALLPLMIVQWSEGLAGTYPVLSLSFTLFVSFSFTNWVVASMQIL